MSLFASIIWNLCALALVLFVAQKLSPIKLVILALLCLATLNVRFEQWSMCEYLYALFDVPSILLACVALWWILSCCFKPLFTASFFTLRIQILWAVFGLVFYLGFFGYGLIDIYHLEFRIQLFVFAFLTLCVYCVDRRVGLGLLFALVCYKFQILGGASIFEYCIDPFLWVQCIIAILWRAVCALAKVRFGGKNGKKVV